MIFDAINIANTLHIIIITRSTATGVRIGVRNFFKRKTRLYAINN